MGGGITDSLCKLFFCDDCRQFFYPITPDSVFLLCRGIVGWLGRIVSARICSFRSGENLAVFGLFLQPAIFDCIGKIGSFESLFCRSSIPRQPEYKARFNALFALNGVCRLQCQSGARSGVQPTNRFEVASNRVFADRARGQLIHPAARDLWRYWHVGIEDSGDTHCLQDFVTCF
jgi:hypothetical protein